MVKGEKKIISTKYGIFNIDISRDKKMAGSLVGGEYPNEKLLKITRYFVNKNSIVVDIGAHIGTFAIPISAETHTVIAFEPSADSFALLSENAKVNNSRLQLHNSALGKEEGRVALVVRNTLNAGANTLTPGGDIPVSTLDSKVPRADFIKIDVEGMEPEVLRGGAGLIERSRPVVVFEVNLSQLRSHGSSPRALERFFTERGYRLYFPLEKNNLLAFSRVRSITLLTALIAPRAWLLWGDSAPFDLLAAPKERRLPDVNFAAAIRHVVFRNIAIKYKRIRAFSRRILS